MANFTHRPGWALASRCLVTHYSGCFCEYVLWMRFTFKSADCQRSRLPSIMWWASSSQLKVWTERRNDLPPARGNPASRWPLDLKCSVALARPGSPACLPTLNILDMPASIIVMSQFFKNKSLYIYTTYCFCSFGEPWPLQIIGSSLEVTESQSWAHHSGWYHHSAGKDGILTQPHEQLVTHEPACSFCSVQWHVIGMRTMDKQKDPSLL